MKSWSNSTRAGHAAIPDSRRPDIRIGRDVYAQGRGIGTLLLRHSEQLVFRSHTEIWLESFVANSRANAFYARRGWTRGGRHLDAKSGMDVWKFSKQKT